MNIAELLAFFFKQDDRFFKTEPTLKQPCFMDYIHSCLKVAFSVFILSRHYKKCYTRLIEHLCKSRHIGHASSGYTVKFIPR